MKFSVEEVKQEIDLLIEYLPSITETEPSTFDRQLCQKLNHINMMSLDSIDNRPHLMEYFFEYAADFGKGFMGSHTREKPYGYAGDYQIIDWIYTQKCFPDGPERSWDEFYHRQHAPKAVRKRKEFFCNLIEATCKNNQGPLSVLNLASGPCRDVSEALTRVEKIIHKQSLFHCVDMDESAIVYARNILNEQSTLAKIQFENANVFNFRPHQKYNLVWSAGLFDYLDDRLATLLLKKMWRWTKAGGEIIFGNFHHRNPSRNYMEWGGGWFLNHRTEEDIFRICKLAGIPLEFVHIDADQLGVCMFCVISKPE